MKAILIILSFLSVQTQAQNVVYDNGRISPTPRYLVIAPKQVRPGEIVQLHVSILNSHPPVVVVRSSIIKEGQEVTYAKDTFFGQSSKVIQMKMPEYASPGNYTMVVEGSTDGTSSTQLFWNQSSLVFHPKRLAVFIQASQHLYLKGSKIRFRVIAVKPNLQVVKKGSINIYVKDALGRTVRRWLAQHLNQGVLERELDMAHPMKYGWWTIQVDAWGYKYSKKIRLENKYPHRFYVNVSMPTYVLDDEFAIAGLVTANLSSGVLVHGNLTLKLEIQPKGQKDEFPTIVREITFFKGITSFLFTLQEISKHTKRLADTKLRVSATVTDWHTLVTRPGSASAIIMSGATHIRILGGGVRTFKPGTPCPVYIAVYGKDGSMFSGNLARQLTVRRIHTKASGLTRSPPEVRHVIPDNSVVHHTFIPEEDDQLITIQVTHTGPPSVTKEVTAYRHYSKKKRYISITTSTMEPKVDEYMVFTVRTSQYVPQVTYLVTGAGNIITSNVLFMNSRQKTFSLSVPRDMVASARIVVYCLTIDGEVLADALNLNVKPVKSNGVSIKVNKGKDFSGDTVEISAQTEPGSFIGFSGADYYMYSKHSRTFLTQAMVEDELLQFDELANSSFKHTWIEHEGLKRNVFFHSPSYGIDANTTFEFAGLTVFTDAQVGRIPNDCNNTRGFLPCFDGSCYTIEQHCDGTRQCQDGADELGCDDDVMPSVPDGFNSFARIIYDYTDTSFMWKDFYTKPDGRIDFRINVPLRPTTWLVGAFALTRDHGLVFTEHPARFDSTRPFYVNVELPSKAFLGEQLGARVSVFNYQSQPIEALLTLVGNKKYKFVRVGDFGIVSSYNPETTGASVQTLVYLSPGESKLIPFPVLPVTKGTVTVTIRAESFAGRYEVEKKISVRMEGVTNFYHTPYLIDLVNQGAAVLPDLQIPVPERFIQPETAWHLYVPGSAKATVSLIGDVVGAGFTSVPLAMKKMWPNALSGALEPYLSDFAINLYWLKFMRETEQLAQVNVNKVLAGLNKYLQSIYAYVKLDGSFAMFRRGRSMKCVWGSAIGLRVLDQGTDTEWEDTLFVETTILNKIATWLTQQQNKTTGEFKEISHVFDTKLVPYEQDWHEERGTVSVTANAVISLAEARHLTGLAKAEAQTALNLGAAYLARKLHSLIDPFQICLVTYALYLANHPRRGEAFSRMNQIRRTGEYVYWARKEIPPNPVEIINTVPFLKPRIERAEDATAVQATAYALMVYLRNNWVTQAVPIMKWLQTQRNSNGGFSTTQDTVTALQALMEFSKRDPNRDLHNILVRVTPTSTPNFRKNIVLNNKNYATLQKISIPNVWGNIKSTAEGSGMALLQLDAQVNVEYPWLLIKPQERSYDLMVERMYFSGRNGSRMDMTVCVRWVRTDLSPRSGFSILDIWLPTGYVIDKDFYRRLSKSGPQVLRRERGGSAGGRARLYFAYIDSKVKTCVSFYAERWYPVANGTIHHRLRIYDYYNPALHNLTMYNTYELFMYHICQVCGSFQCPYCPYYNAAGRDYQNFVCVLSLLIMAAAWISAQRH